MNTWPYPGAILAFATIFSLEVAIATGAQFTDVSSFALPGNSATLSWGNPVWGDFDNDEALDLIVPTHFNGRPLYFINRGDGTFSNRTSTSGFRRPFADNTDWHGFAAADYDRDGNLDVFVTVGGGRGVTLGTKLDMLFRGTGGGNFTEVASWVGVTNSLGRGRMGFWFGANRDGLVDLFILNLTQNPSPYLQGSSVLYRNTRGGYFTDVTRAVGLNGAHALPDQLLNCSIADYDQDGVPDMVATGTHPPDTLMRGRAKGGFEAATSDSGLPPRTFGRGIAWGDYNNDGWLDLFIARGFEENENHVPPTPDQLRQSLYRNNRDGTFTDVSEEAGIAVSINGSAGLWGDFDNDGWLDLFVANVGDSNGAENANLLFRNNGDGTFAEIALSAGVQGPSGVRHAAGAWADYDNDGFLDLAVKRGFGERSLLSKGTLQLWRNSGNSHHWLKVKLHGVRSNRDGLGAKLTCQTAISQYREHIGGGGGEYFSQGAQPEHFGLGDAEAATLTIIWPSGKVDVLPDLPVNQQITVVEGQHPAR